jgi:hypothetical protein
MFFSKGAVSKVENCFIPANCKIGGAKAGILFKLLVPNIQLFSITDFMRLRVRSRVVARDAMTGLLRQPQNTISTLSSHELPPHFSHYSIIYQENKLSGGM